MVGWIVLACGIASICLVVELSIALKNDFEPAFILGALLVPYACALLFCRRRVLDRFDLEWICRIVHARFEEIGDWLDPAAPPDRPRESRTDHHLVATAYYAHSAHLVSRVAALLGKSDDQASYARLAEAVRTAFRYEYVTPAGRLTSDSQTAYVLALCFDLLRSTEQRERAGRRLAELVREGGHHIGTGFVGTPLICDALCDAGEFDTAYRLLLETTCPSWPAIR